MAAYFLVNVKEVLDPDAYQYYKQNIGQVVEAFGGRYLAVGGETATVEGSLSLNFPVLIEFPSLERAKQWYTVCRCE